jgi:hypothetical protein
MMAYFFNFSSFENNLFWPQFRSDEIWFNYYMFDCFKLISWVKVRFDSGSQASEKTKFVQKIIWSAHTFLELLVKWDSDIRPYHISFRTKGRKRI